MGKEKIREPTDIKISDPQQTILDSTAARTLMMSGVGSGKTHIGALVSGEYITEYPQVKGFIGANTYGQLSKSTLSGIFKVWQEMYGWVQDVNYIVDKKPPSAWIKFGAKLKSYENVISFDNGCMIFVASLDAYKQIDGTEFGWAILDETKDTREEAVKEVIVARLRQIGIWVSGDSTYSLADIERYIDQGKVERRIDEDGVSIFWNLINDSQMMGFNPLYILTSPAKVQWLNEWFDINDHLEEISQKIFSKTDFYHAVHGRNSVTISSTFHNKRNLSAGYIETLIDGYRHNPSLVDMMIYGSPIAKSGGEWFSRFSRDKHVKKVVFNEEYPIYITLDFNVKPYMTLLVSQLVKDEETERVQWNIIQEYCLSNPQNNTEDICSEFLYDYAGKIKALFYTGDPSGKARQTVSKEMKHNYTVVEKVLYMYCSNYSNKVQKSAPSLAKCRDFFNKMLAGGFQIDINIDDSCKNLITDMEFLREDINGTYKKVKVKDAISGETIEKYGHCADAWRYLGVVAFDAEYRNYELF
jgi:hypothetical protein